MAKIKVYQLAKELNFSSASLLKMFEELGFKLKSHMSTVEDEMRAQLSKKMANQREEVKQEYARKSKMVSQPQPAKVEEDLVVAQDEKIKKAQPAAFTNLELLASKMRGKKKRKRKMGNVDQAEVKENVRKILAKIGAGDRRKKYRREDGAAEGESDESKNKLLVSEFVSVGELAKMMSLSASEVMAKCMEIGTMVTINQRLDFETITLVADEFGYEAQLMEEYSEETIGEEEKEDTENLAGRPPVVTVMGHVDHGKTSLLDYIRKTNVTSSEAGGITQHIGAYVVKTSHGPVTFLDTPGHEAFTAMRSRGAKVTDVVVLVVAADSGVMPQTLEAIDHAKAAGVPIVVAINKMDLPQANPTLVKSKLAESGVVVEEFGGNAQAVCVSAKTGENIERLLELLALETDMLELKANPGAKARGAIVEAELNKGMGPVATVLVQNGTLHVGDPFVVGVYAGRVRTMLNEAGQHVTEAGPSVPVRVLGLDGVPQAGDTFVVLENEREAKEIASKRRQAKHERDIRQMAVTLDNWRSHVAEGEKKELHLIIKGDVDGSVEALSSQIEQLSNDEIAIRVVHKSVGAIKETDIDLAAASKAIIVGFHIRPNSKIREYAEREGVDIRLYRIIYEVVEEIKKAMTGLLAPIEKENILGRAEVRQVFRVSKAGNVAGSFVKSGTISRGAKARVIRDDVEIADTTIASLRRVKDDVRQVASGFECGILLQDFPDVKSGDIVEAYEIQKVSRTL